MWSFNSMSCAHEHACLRYVHHWSDVLETRQLYDRGPAIHVRKIYDTPKMTVFFVLNLLYHFKTLWRNTRTFQTVQTFVCWNLPQFWSFLNPILKIIINCVRRHHIFTQSNQNLWMEHVIYISRAWPLECIWVSHEFYRGTYNHDKVLRWL